MGRFDDRGRFDTLDTTGPREPPRTRQRNIDEAENLGELLDAEIPPEFSRWARRIGIGLGIAWLGFSSWFIARPGENAIVTNLGSYSRTETSGIGFKLPWPIEQVYKVNIEEVRRLEVGFRTGENDNEQFKAERQMLTGDENIADVTYVVQWQVSDSRDYFFNARNAEKLLYDASQAAMRQVIGDNGIDEAMTTGKERLQNEAGMILAEIMQSYRVGIGPRSVQLQDVDPPQPVDDAFKDVQRAKEQALGKINQARTYENEKIPKARGEAEQRTNQAIAYYAQTVNDAKGNIARFIEVRKEYLANPAVTRDRLYIDAMTRVYTNADPTIVDEKLNNLIALLNQQPGGK